MKKLFIVTFLLFSSSFFTFCNAQYVCTDILNFNGPNGQTPEDCSLTLDPSGTVLYGVTIYGGINGYGNIFRINTDGSNYKDLLDFNGTNGEDPTGALVLYGGVLYGETYQGGATYGNNTIYYGNGLGCVYSINTDGSGYKDIYNFTGSNGSNPLGSLTLSGGRIYGAASTGGTSLINYEDQFGDGCIFSMNMDGSGYQDLLDFNGTNGQLPTGSLVLSGNILYGMTRYGGADTTIQGGCVFAIPANATNGNGYQDLLCKLPYF